MAKGRASNLSKRLQAMAGTDVEAAAAPSANDESTTGEPSATATESPAPPATPPAPVEAFRTRNPFQVPALGAFCVLKRVRGAMPLQGEPAWDFCERYNPETRTYERRHSVASGAPIHEWVLGTWGSGTYCSHWFNASGMPIGKSDWLEISDPAWLPRSPKVGGPVGVGGATSMAGSIPTGQQAQAPGGAPMGDMWSAWTEMERRQDERRRREREEEADRRRRDREEAEERRERDRRDFEETLRRDRERAKAELEYLEKRAEIQRKAQEADHEHSLARMQALAGDTGSLSRDDFEDALGDLEERIEKRVADEVKEAAKGATQGILETLKELAPVVAPILQEVAQAVAARRRQQGGGGAPTGSV